MNKKIHIATSFFVFAEKGGFEPPVQLPVRQFSKLLVSATHPSLLTWELVKLTLRSPKRVQRYYIFPNRPNKKGKKCTFFTKSHLFTLIYVHIEPFYQVVNG